MIIFLSYLAIPLQPVYMKIGWSLDWPGKLGWRQSGHLLTFSISKEECHLKVRASQMGLQKFQTSTEGQTMHTLYAHNLIIIRYSNFLKKKDPENELRFPAIV